MKHLLVGLLFFVCISNSVAQDYYIDASKVSQQATKSFVNQLKNANRKINVARLANNNNPGIITIKRHLVHLSSFPPPTYPITTQNWNERLLKLNETFLGTGLQFQYDPDIGDIFNVSAYNFDLNTNDNNIFSNDVSSMLNVYVVNSIKSGSMEFSGFATGGIPYYAPSFLGNFELRNDLLITYDAMTICEGIYTLTHETGHIFGLLHTFENLFGQELVNGSNANESGDFISDTKANLEGLQKTQIHNCSQNSINNFTISDCNKEPFRPDINNVMSYFFVQNQALTVLQKHHIQSTADNFRGELIYPTWAKIKIPWYSDMSNEYCDTPTTVTFSAERQKNVGQYEWQFSGGLALDPLNSVSVRVKFEQFGSYSYKLTVRDANGNNTFETLPQVINISDKTLEAKKLPFLEGFENGIPNSSSGFTFYNNYKDCNYFESKYVGGYNQSLRSLCKNNFFSKVDDQDEFITPYLSLDNLQSLKLSFDYAYAYQTNKTDTLTIGYILCNQYHQIFRKGGYDLQTHPPVDGNQFIPTSNDWKSVPIDIQNVLTDPTNKTIRFVFGTKSGNGNRLYIDNIKVSGAPISATNSATAIFTRADHRITLNWPDYATDETGYQIERSFSEDEPFATVATVDANTTSWYELPSNANTVYFYRIKAINTVLSIPYSNIVNAISCPNPTKLTSLTAALSGTRNAYLTWTDNNNFKTGFDIYYSYGRNEPMQKLVSLPATATNYLHMGLPQHTIVYYMVKVVELNFTSPPSDTAHVNFMVYIPSNTITKLETFFDIDPGVGNGYALAYPSGSAFVNATYTQPLVSVQDGLHNFYLRAQQSNGYWSSSFSKSILKVTASGGDKKIEAIEYFIDTDPGIGNGSMQNVSGIVGNTFSVPVDLETTSDGVHSIFLRAKDNYGLWSNIYSGSFVRLPGVAGPAAINKMEYSIDSLPDFGLGIDVPVPISLSFNLNIQINLATTLPGLHTLYLRVRDNRGKWSNIYSTSFISMDGMGGSLAVKSLEYFFDNDPGFDLGVKMDYAANAPKIIQDISMPISGLSDGIHFLYMRAKDQNGMWSNVFSKSFLKLSGTGGKRKVVELQYAVDNGLLIGNGTGISLTADSTIDVKFTLPPLANGKHYLSMRAKDNANLWSNIYIDSLFVSDEAFCQLGSNVQYKSAVNGASTYVWQENAGTGWVPLTNTAAYGGVATQTLTIIQPPTSWYGKKYRCITNGVTGVEFTLKFKNIWTGVINDDWFNIGNWSCNNLPDSFVDVIVENGVTNYPIVDGNGICRSLYLKNGATVTVKASKKLDIKGQ